jgi:antitoxin component of MazEF toxin-antitoxin module
MPEQRRPYRVGTSIVVALPLAVRTHLGLEPGQEVYWHLVRGKEVVLAMTAERKGGHPEGLRLQKELAAAKRECERLRRKAYARPESAVNMGIAHGWAQAMRQNTETFDLMKWMEGRFDDLAARIPFRRRPGRPARSAAVESHPEVETLQTPVLEAEDSKRGRTFE